MSVIEIGYEQFGMKLRYTWPFHTWAGIWMRCLEFLVFLFYRSQIGNRTQAAEW